MCSNSALARQADLQTRVKYEVKSHRLADLIDARPADELVRTLREVVSDTFEEMHSDDQNEKVLLQIRQRIWAVLPAFNDMLFQIEIEPIAAVPPAEEDGIRMRVRSHRRTSPPRNS